MSPLRKAMIVTLFTWHSQDYTLKHTLLAHVSEHRAPRATPELNVEAAWLVSLQHGERHGQIVLVSRKFYMLAFWVGIAIVNLERMRSLFLPSPFSLLRRGFFREAPGIILVLGVSRSS